MSQKVALVTGAMGGLGTAISQALAKAGHKVVVAYHPEFDNKEAWLKEQEAAGFKDFVPVAGDVADLASVEKLVAEAVQKAGEIDILVNNAGITRDKLFAKLERSDWDAVINTNLSSLYNVTKQVSAKMVARGWGRIINISSVNGVKGQAGQTNYSAAKAGVIGFTKALAQELAYDKKNDRATGVTVNAIAPGYVATKMVTAIDPKYLQPIIDSVPLKRLAKPEEIGFAVAFLADELSGFTTGATLNINGGLNYQ
jgi:acetoacetyl-CoA reductase